MLEVQGHSSRGTVSSDWLQAPFQDWTFGNRSTFSLKFDTENTAWLYYAGSSGDWSGLPWIWLESVFRNSSADIEICLPNKGLCCFSHLWIHFSISKYTLTLSISKKYGIDKISRSIWILETTTWKQMLTEKKVLALCFHVVLISEPFELQATSEFSAEKQIHELLFPRNTHQEGQSPQARHKYWCNSMW